MRASTHTLRQFRTLPRFELVIIGPEGKPLGANEVGQIYFRDLTIMRRTARLLDDSNTAERCASLCESVRAAFNKKFLNPDTGQYDTASQTANAMPLAIGLVDPSHRPQRMVLANPRFQIDVAEQRPRPLVPAPHPFASAKAMAKESQHEPAGQRLLQHPARAREGQDQLRVE